jgi:hypothetical protein
VEALCGILNVRWANNGIVTAGSYCTAQGIVQQIGDVGVGLITLVGPLLCRRLARMMHLYPDPCCPHIPNCSVGSGYWST